MKINKAESNVNLIELFGDTLDFLMLTYFFSSGMYLLLILAGISHA